MMSYCIRSLTLKDLVPYKTLRLEALKTNPGIFRRSHDEEAAMPESFWSQRITNPAGTIFGLFDGPELIGITAVVIENEGYGYLTHSYIKPQYRKQGLSKLFFETRITWAKGRGLKRIVVNHRESNAASKAAITKFGFQFTHSEIVNWPDGNCEPLLYYELYL